MDTDNSAGKSAEHRVHTQVDPADLRRLLEAGPDSCLVLSEGRMQVQDRSPGDGAGLVVVTRAGLVAQLGESPADNDLVTQAALLDSEVRSLGA
ncbi:hypothetical protein [Nocardia flavorosea]|uniref:Uncharacterized protein n=1 Tax=Nocardia flavorosea TaxID=53429 RepID=A0A846YLN0_9NOCA|nr:hypothetical protein [Nocardia flavorosea]NKY58494.1 hypothetical protein [Nocardia flavorosea]